MPDIAKKATLDLRQKKLFVDGQEFPWAINEEGPTLSGFGQHGMKTVTLTFYADDVEVISERADVDPE